MLADIIVPLHVLPPVIGGTFLIFVRFSQETTVLRVQRCSTRVVWTLIRV